MKETATNVWKDGLNKDLNPMNTPNTVLTDNLNGTFITYNGNELSLQNDMGNVFTTSLSDGFYPIGFTEFGDIFYIVSVSNSQTMYASATLKEGANKQEVIASIIQAADDKLYSLDEEELYNIFDEGLPLYKDSKINLFTEILPNIAGIDFKIESRPSSEFEIGSFPSLDPSNIRDNLELELPFEPIYRPLHNLLESDEGNSEIFRTTELNNYDEKHPLSIEVQPSYDGSVNLILTDDKNVPRLINSGFAVLENGKGKFVKRNQGVKTNYYTVESIDRTTRLINNSEKFTYVELGKYNKNGEWEQDGVQAGGQLKGGNYTFYFKFGDDDGNKTDIVCESGIVSIFKGTPNEPKTISGAFSNELTDKLVQLSLFNIDTNYSRIYAYYTREYCDLNGYRLTECKELVEPFKITGNSQVLTISGVESTTDISVEELNIAYYSISSAKAIAQQQNMLFLGNISTSSPNNVTLQEISYDIQVGIEQSDLNIGSVNVWNYEPGKEGANDTLNAEYYNPQNIYYKLGYWPNELYRFGIVYIKSDGTYTQAFNLKGCRFDDLYETNMDDSHRKYQGNKPTDGLFLDTTTKLDNIAGVFKTPDVNILYNETARPLYFTFKLDNSVIDRLKNNDIIGYFIVRQKRMPITVCQGFGIGIDKECYIPMLQYNDKYYAQSFITSGNRELTYKEISIDGDVIKNGTNDPVFYIYEATWKTWTGGHFRGMSLIGPKGKDLDYKYYTDTKEITKATREQMIQACIEVARNVLHVTLVSEEPKSVDNYNTTHTEIDSDQVGMDLEKDRFIDTVQEGGSGLLSLEAMVNPEIQSLLCGTTFTLDPTNKCTLKRNGIVFVGVNYESTSKENTDAKLTYIPQNTPLKYIDNVGFSTQAGDGINVSSFGFLEEEPQFDSEHQGEEENIVRGQFTPFIGAVSNNVEPNILYNIRIPHSDDYKADFITRANNYAEFYAVSNKISLNGSYELVEGLLNVFRGDCFINTVTLRMHRNFIDATAPVTDKIVKPNAWAEYYKGYDKTAPNYVDDPSKSEWNNYTHWDEINLSDLNTVSLGHWITFKCLASSNLGLRSEDTTNVSEMALMGNPRSFYPLIGASTSTGMKLEDSMLLNDGYNATVGRRRYTIKQDTPYDRNDFANRIMFSNVSVTDAFTNGYRTFQGASYQDYTKQYGAIMKLLPWGNNLFCVFEHGIAIVPINEKALMQTTTEQTIHIYGHGVLPEQLSVISQDYGTLWPDSVIRTPIGIYGVDTSAKKIWRYTDKNGLETISDLKLQRFLNDNINLNLTRQTIIGETNVKTHYNNYKGDVMFTFYNEGIEWNLCYNERQALWVTRYDWLPLFSGNINNTFYSIKCVPFNNENNITMWKHGRTGVDYQFYPTLWYGEQHPFEFEFVVNEPVGLHKIFEDLIIISNNVQPIEIEFEFIGDDYLFNKARIYHDGYNIYGNSGEDRPYRKDLTQFTKENYDISNFKPIFYNASVNYDKVLDTHTLVVNQVCKNLETYGRRLGNIQYKEDGWYTNIEPLRYNANLKNPNISEFKETDPFVSAKLRDKWIKIRIKYKGDRLAIINGVTTFENISYS